MYECAAEFAFNTLLFVTICKPSSYKLKWNAHSNVPLRFSLHLGLINTKKTCFIWHILCNNGLSHPGCESEICRSCWKYHQTLVLFSYAVGESYYARLHDKKPSGLFRESRNVLYFH